MPVATREAMLEGIRRYDRIIVGAYVDEHGGVCPMLAAHRCGGRTDFLSFAKSWDRFARSRNAPRFAKKLKRAATERELRILVQQLQDSLAESEGLELDRAIAEHRALLAEGHRRRARLMAAAEPRGEMRVRRLSLPRRRRRRAEDVARATAPGLRAPSTARR